jgi:hypothetical protein
MSSRKGIWGRAGLAIAMAMAVAGIGTVPAGAATSAIRGQYFTSSPGIPVKGCNQGGNKPYFNGRLVRAKVNAQGQSFTGNLAWFSEGGYSYGCQSLEKGTGGIEKMSLFGQGNGSTLDCPYSENDAFGLFERSAPQQLSVRMEFLNCRINNSPTFTLFITISATYVPDTGSGINVKGPYYSFSYAGTAKLDTY